MSVPVRRPARRVAAVVAACLALALVPGMGGGVASAADDVTFVPGAGEACNGVKPTAGSANTLKTVTGGDLQPGGTARFTVTYPASQLEAGDRFVLTDCFVREDTGAVLDKFEIRFVPNAQDFSFDYVLTIPADLPVGTQVCNYVKTTEGPSKSPASNRKGGACFTAGGTLRVEKVDPDGALLPGARFTVSCVPTSALPPVVISGLEDAAPSGAPVSGNPVTGWANDGSIAVNAPEGTPCTVTELAAPAGYSLASPATVVHQVPRAGAPGATKTFVNTPVSPTPTLTKTAAAPWPSGSVVPRGEVIGFSVAVGNTGTAPATGTVVDTLPLGLGTPTDHAPAVWDGAARTLTWSGVTVLPGGSTTFTYKASVLDEAAGSLVNTVTWLGLQASTTHTVPSLVPAPAIGKSADPADGATVARGTPIGFTVTVRNTGTGTTAVGDVVDVLPTGLGAPTSISGGGAYDSATRRLTWSGVSLGTGAERSFTYTATVTGDAPAGPLTNTATWLGLPASTTHTVGLPAGQLTKTSPTDGSTVEAGDLVTYVLTARNTGAVPLTPAVVVDALPAAFVLDQASVVPAGVVGAGTVTWDLGTLDPGEQVELRYSGLAAAVTAPTAMVNTARLNGGPPQTTTHTVVPSGLGLTKSVEPAGSTPVRPGDRLTYALVVTNTGQLTEQDVVVRDVVPGSDPARTGSGATTYQSGSAACLGAGPCVVDVAADVVTWAVGDLEPGQSRTVTFAVTVDAPAGDSAVPDVLNVGTASSERVGPTPSNEVRTPVTVVLADPPVTQPPTPPAPPATPRTLPFTAPRALPFTGAWLLPLLALGTGSSLVGALLVGAARRRQD